MKRVAAIIAASLIVPAVALGHTGDRNTQLQNASIECNSRFSGCKLVNEAILIHPGGRGFLWTRAHTSGNGHKCWQWIATTHDNVVYADEFRGCN